MDCRCRSGIASAKRRLSIRRRVRTAGAYPRPKRLDFIYSHFPPPFPSLAESRSWGHIRFAAVPSGVRGFRGRQSDLVLVSSPRCAAIGDSPFCSVVAKLFSSLPQMVYNGGDDKRAMIACIIFRCWEARRMKGLNGRPAGEIRYRRVGDIPGPNFIAALP
jgi:hypothetical protein